MLEKIHYKTVETPSEDARIVRSALRYADCVYTHVRHSYALHEVAALKVYDRITCGQADQGFVDQYGNYFDRKTSLQIAIKAKQTPVSGRNLLFSEDIFNNDGSQIYLP